MDKTKAIQIWEECYGDREIAYDFASHPMKKDDYQNAESHYGWDIDFKKQYNSSYDNMIPCSLNTIHLRGKKDSFKISNHTFEVRKGPYHGSFSIYDITDRSHPLNMDPTDENQDKEFNNKRFHDIASNGRDSQQKFHLPTLLSINDNIFNSHLENADLGVEATVINEDDLFDNLEETPAVAEEVQPIETPAAEENNVETAPVEEPTPVEEPADETVEEQPIENESVVEEPQPEPVPAEEDEPEVIEPELSVQEEVISELEEIKIEPIVESLEEEKPAEEPVVEETIPEEVAQEEVLAGENFVEEEPHITLVEEEPVVQEPAEPQVIEKVVEKVVEKIVEVPVVDESLKQENEALKQQIDALNEEKNNLNDQLTSLKNENTALLEDKTALSDAKVLAEAKNMALIGENNTLKSDNEAVRSEKEKIETENQSLKANVETLTAQNQELENQKQVLITEKENLQNEANAEVSQNEQTVTSILEASNALKERINVLTAEAEQKKQEYETLKEEKEAISSELEMVKENNLDLSAQVNQLSASQEDAVALNNQITELNQKITELNNRLEEVQKEKEDLDNQLFDANNRIQYLADDVAEKESSHDAFNQEMEAKTNELAEKEAQIEELKTQNENLSKECEDNKAQFEVLKSQWIDNLTEMKNIQADYNQLDAQSQLVDDQIDVLNSENKKLSEELDALKAEHEELNTNFQNQKMELDSYKKENEEKAAVVENLKQTAYQAESNYQAITEDKDRLNARIEALNNQIVTKQDEINENQTKIAAMQLTIDKLTNEKNNDTESFEQVKQDLMTQIDFLSLHGDNSHFADLQNELQSFGIEANLENIENLLTNHKEWKVKEDISINENIEGTEVDSEDIPSLAEEKKKYEKAISYYIAAFKEENAEATDFAGRLIKMNDYGKKNEETGWDYCLYDVNEVENADNVLVANYRSLKDFRRNEPFSSNGHMYQVVKENGRYMLQAADFVTDPYDYSQALRVVDTNRLKTSPLLYLFVKCVPVQGAMPDRDAVMDFFDVMDRTAKRCCPQSFVEMKTVIGGAKGNLAFVTFDGSVDESYREVLNYAVLMNSYRREFFKRGKLNCIFVVNEVNIPFSKRHLDFEALISEANDVELRALRYEFNMAVINSQIKRSIHIGPRILDKMPLDQSLLKDSLIGQGEFAKMYHFDQKFKVYNFIYNLSHNETDGE